MRGAAKLARRTEGGNLGGSKVLLVSFLIKLRFTMDELNTSGTTQLSLLDADILRRAAKWARFLAIVGFVVIGLMVLFGFFAGSLMTGFMAMQGATVGMPMGNAMAGFGVMYTVIFLVIALLYFFPTLYLFNFATRTLRAVNGAFDGPSFSGATEALRKLFAFMGVLTVIVLCLYGLIFLIAGITVMSLH